VVRTRGLLAVPPHFAIGSTDGLVVALSRGLAGEAYLACAVLPRVSGVSSLGVGFRLLSLVGSLCPGGSLLLVSVVAVGENHSATWQTVDSMKE
jgi:hypothetical protein